MELREFRGAVSPRAGVDLSPTPPSGTLWTPAGEVYAPMARLLSHGGSPVNPAAETRGSRGMPDENHETPAGADQEDLSPGKTEESTPPPPPELKGQAPEANAAYDESAEAADSSPDEARRHDLLLRAYKVGVRLTEEESGTIDLAELERRVLELEQQAQERLVGYQTGAPPESEAALKHNLLVEAFRLGVPLTEAESEELSVAQLEERIAAFKQSHASQ